MIETYKTLPLALQIAMHFQPGVSVDDLPAETRFEIEEIHLHAFMGQRWQTRADYVRRAEAAIKRLGIEAKPDTREEDFHLAVRIDRVLSAPPDVWTVGDLIPLLRDMLKRISGPSKDVHAGQLAPEPKPGAGLDPLPDGMMLPVEKATTEDVLRIFRAFVLQNVTQWATGAGDPHHPMWELATIYIDKPDPTQGPDWAFIQPLNRQRRSVLEALYDDMMSAREAEKRGG